GLTDGLAARSTGGQAGVVGPLQVVIFGEVADRGVQFLLELAGAAPVGYAAAGEGHGIDGPTFRLVGAGDQRHELVVVVDALAGPQVDAEAGAVTRRVVEQVGVGQRLAGRRRREGRVGADVSIAFRVADVAGEVEVLDLGGELGGEAAGVPRRDEVHAAF